MSPLGKGVRSLPAGRLDEVISVVARRRRRALEQKLALVAEVSRPGALVAVVADRHGPSRSLLFEWRRQVRKGTMPGVVRATATLVRVRIVEDAPPKETPHRSVERAAKSASVVEVVPSNGRMLRVQIAHLRHERFGRSSERLVEAACWTHARCYFHDELLANGSPLAREATLRMQSLVATDADGPER